MKFFLIFAVFFSFIQTAFAHTEHYKKIRYLKYDLYLNDNLIGSHTFNFKKVNEFLYVNSTGHFKVSKMGIKLMDYHTESEEIYKSGRLIEYKSKTLQNDKRKYVNLKYDRNKNVFLIDGSSFKGEANKDAIIGSWWNHDIISKNKHISAISGRILPQKVNFLGKKSIKINKKSYSSLKFHFISDDNKPINKKKINLHVWYDKKTMVWIKSSSEKLGKWEYRLKDLVYF